jgi:hypothetical protein
MKIITTTFLLVDTDDDQEFIDNLPKPHLIQVRGYQYPDEIGAEGAAAISTALDVAILETHAKAVRIMMHEDVPSLEHPMQHPTNSSDPTISFDDLTIPPGTTIH